MVAIREIPALCKQYSWIFAIVKHDALISNCFCPSENRNCSSDSNSEIVRFKLTVILLFASIRGDGKKICMPGIYTGINHFFNTICPETSISGSLIMYNPDEIVKYVFKNRQRYAIRLVNSDNDRTDDIKGATNPETPFTIAIGGNIVSRGVTFNNLLTMFFTRTVKHKIQQDTYIQRARMFGNRTGYLDHFELHIPETLYLDWHQAFSLHGLSMASIETKKPVWLEDRRIRAVSSSSIDKSSLSIDRGEISFEKFNVSDELLKLTLVSKKGYAHFQKVIDHLPTDYLSDHIYRFVESTRPFDEDSIVFHVTREIKGSEAIDEENISRARGMYGGQDYERDTFPKAVHHFKIFMNDKGVGRVIYNYRATDKSITFLKVRRNKI